jgi:hypothetical protein
LTLNRFKTGQPRRHHPNRWGNRAQPVDTATIARLCRDTFAQLSKYSTEDIIMTEIKHHTIRANDIRQHYIAAGEVASVVLLHGFPETSYAWRHQVPELAKKYRVIAPDLRGYGETEKPATGYDKRNMAKDLRELMRALEIPKIAPVGHDRGARVATRFAKDHPEALDRLVVMDNIRPESSHATSTQ